MARLEKLVTADKETQRRYTALSGSIATETAALQMRASCRHSEKRHMANLLINTDADQIIIAEAGPHPHGSLPPITYRSGGLENAEDQEGGLRHP